MSETVSKDSHVSYIRMWQCALMCRRRNFARWAVCECAISAQLEQQTSRAPCCAGWLSSPHTPFGAIPAASSPVLLKPKSVRSLPNLWTLPSLWYLCEWNPWDWSILESSDEQWSFSCSLYLEVRILNTVFVGLFVCLFVCLLVGWLVGFLFPGNAMANSDI